MDGRPNHYAASTMFQSPSPTDLYSKGRKRMKFSEGKEYFKTSSHAYLQNNLDKKNIVDYSNPFAVANMLQELNQDKYGSVTKDILDLQLRKDHMLKQLSATYPTLLYNCMDKKPSEEVLMADQLATPLPTDVIVLEDDRVALASRPLVIIDSDDEEPGNHRPLVPYQDVFSKKPAGEFLMKDWLASNCTRGQNLKDTEANFMDETQIRKDKGVYVGVDDDVGLESSEQSDVDFDGLDDIWKEMTVALECSKDNAVDPSSDGHGREEDEDCDHSFLLKDDLGYVCRICGVVQRAIDTIIEFQYVKGTRTTRTHRLEARTTKDGEATDILPDGMRMPGHDFMVAEISAHPRHRKQMKPHQIEGFNFLLSNLVTDNPGGCILAHAPGSGKTFMIISFIQSFMAKYPFAKPLVVLPRGILGTWKREFQRWQVEDIPLFDMYSVKADSRSQQLEVLKQWAGERSILFLGYKQFSAIVCDNDTSNSAAACQEILLTHPSILILDEGHTPRNQDTDVLTSLEKVQTPRKVVLSGTLYQNHVKEVFNILNLVRPKFLKLETSRAIKRRILSRVPISSRRHLSGSDNDFYDLVERTLLKDENFKMKATVIQDLREMTSKVLHYYKGDFLDELPGLVDFTVFLNLSPRQKREVVELKKLSRKFKICSDGSAIYVHPQLTSLLKNSTAKDRVDVDKIDQMLEVLDEKEGAKAKFYLNLLRLCESGGEKLLVFGQYLLPLKFLERLTMKVKGWSLGKEMFMITGDSDSELREFSMERFNSSPEARVFFGSIKACGEGISLVGASRIVILDVHLNPSVTRQAIGRAFRPGQERKVYTYRLVAAESPEEEDHSTCFRKELIAKLWFEWNEYCGKLDFEMETADVMNCGDMFLETPWVNQDVVALYKRLARIYLVKDDNCRLMLGIISQRVGFPVVIE
ncbi:hypothetical protein RJ640_017103 [Escallonia rubra]|uniref:Uncharacterized protein n=1 Tax=Escallonia rubra TaxID=112253 RepID=A0AA88QU34_9ASTE|nr:hypothetical protein RJ640_017103 [Escallonia rubra]